MNKGFNGSSADFGDLRSLSQLQTNSNCHLLNRIAPLAIRQEELFLADFRGFVPCRCLFLWDIVSLI